MRLVLGALLASASAALGPHVPGQVCHAWTREYGCQPPPAVSVWPHPREMSVGTGPARSVGQDLELVCGEGAHQDDVLQLAMERYTAIIHGTGTREGVGLAEAAPAAGDPLTTLTIRVAGGDAVLNATKFAELDESYTLTVPATGSATLTAETTLGALRGLETFAQTIDYSSQSPQIAAVPVHISDEPRFSWRGLRIDSSRHFLPMGTIRAALDAMAAAKLNVLMWHVVDANSFPLKLDGFPELADKGAYCPACVYTTDDVRAVVEYARQRGIRVQAEIDVPGHSGWQCEPTLRFCSESR